jgi:hypothetical protein
MKKNDPYAELEIPAFLKRKKGEKPEPYDEDTLAWLERMRAQGKKETGMSRLSLNDDPCQPKSNIASSPNDRTPLPGARERDAERERKATKKKVKAVHNAGTADTFHIEGLPKRPEAPAASEAEPKPRKEKPMARTESEARDPSPTAKLYAYWAKHGTEKARAFGVDKLKLHEATARVRCSQWDSGLMPTKPCIEYAKAQGIKVPTQKASPKSDKTKPKKKAKSKSGTKH